MICPYYSSTDREGFCTLSCSICWHPYEPCEDEEEYDDEEYDEED